MFDQGKLQKDIHRIHHDDWMLDILKHHSHHNHLNFELFKLLFEAYEYGIISHKMPWESNVPDVDILVDLGLIKIKYKYTSIDGWALANETYFYCVLTYLGLCYVRESGLISVFNEIMYQTKMQSHNVMPKEDRLNYRLAYIHRSLMVIICICILACFSPMLNIRGWYVEFIILLAIGIISHVSKPLSSSMESLHFDVSSFENGLWCDGMLNDAYISWCLSRKSNKQFFLLFLKRHPCMWIWYRFFSNRKMSDARLERNIDHLVFYS